jgi:hypothetical protein
LLWPRDPIDKKETSRVSHIKPRQVYAIQIHSYRLNSFTRNTYILFLSMYDAISFLVQCVMLRVKRLLLEACCLDYAEPCRGQQYDAGLILC